MTKTLLYISIILCFLNSCASEVKSKEFIINNELAYPMTIKDVVRKIGQPDSITSENHDSGSFGIRINTIYHYGSNQLIFSPHNVYMGKK